MGGGGAREPWWSLPSKFVGVLFSLSLSLPASRPPSPSSVSNCFKFLMDLGRRSAARLVADLAFLGFVGDLLRLSLVFGGLLVSLSLSFPPHPLREMDANPLFVGDGGTWSPRSRPRGLSGDRSCLFCCSSPRACAYRCGSMAAAATGSNPTWNTPLLLMGGRLCCETWKAGVVAIGARRGADGRPDPSELFRRWPPPMNERKTEDLDRWWRESVPDDTDGGKPLKSAMEDMAAAAAMRVAGAMPGGT
ncbi:hypothetical protein VTI74DRAFT_5508 [Chaetomium olivicolor]